MKTFRHFRDFCRATDDELRDALETWRGQLEGAQFDPSPQETAEISDCIQLATGELRQRQRQREEARRQKMARQEAP